MKKKWLVGSLLVLCVFIIAAVGISRAFAEPTIPDGVQIYYVGGKVCIRDVQMGRHFCWCENECGGCDVCEPCPTKTPCDECKTETPAPTPTPPTETPSPPGPTPTKKPKCNRGLGNGAEGCDPGNSAGKPGSAGENEG